MNTKLTLNIDKSTVERAKEYAYKNGKSLSKLVESYLKLVTQKTKDADDLDISPNVRALMGSFKASKDFDYKEELANAIAEKHLK